MLQIPLAFLIFPDMQLQKQTIEAAKCFKSPCSFPVLWWHVEPCVRKCLWPTLEASPPLCLVLFWLAPAPAHASWLSVVACLSEDGSPLKWESEAPFSDQALTEVRRPWLGFSTSIWINRRRTPRTTNLMTGWVCNVATFSPVACTTRFTERPTLL